VEYFTKVENNQKQLKLF